MILSPIEQQIKSKIEKIGIPLKDWDVQINYGIKTGYNDAFIISGSKKDEILANCKTEEERKKTAEIIRPILRGRDIKRYGYDFADLWLINTHNGIKEKGIKPINIDDYPAIKKHLDQYWSRLEKRADQGVTPYNLRNCAYMEDFYKQKIVWKRVGSKIRFSFDENHLFALDSTCFATGKFMKFLVAFLNSSIGNYMLKDSPKTGTGDLLISVQAISPLLIPKPKSETLKKIEKLIENIISLNKKDFFKEEEKIDNILNEIYNFTEEEINYIKDKL
ncbi:TaqI-like C-terminal specificity domain-containing protein [Ornithobacterium rhinotracheale]|uniref:TaqI-like C-terminal specificity domain-containing protein n=1 Tax=Ornithobacterium rhinotracheale TaxID=28251 RepID=UPI0039FCD6D5